MTVTDPSRFLDVCLRERLSRDVWGWLARAIESAAAQGAGAGFFLAFSSVPRRLGKQPLALRTDERDAASELREGWQPGGWSVDQAGRARLVLALAAHESPPLEGRDDGMHANSAEDAARETAFLRSVESLFEDADLGELVALYQALPLLPQPEAWRARAAEGVRSNMQAVFEAVACHNPYPAEQLDDGAFNQLVLKCLFVGSPLRAVWNLDRRLNPALTEMLCDYARERWAAGRSVPWELWRGVGPLAQGKQLELLARALAEGTQTERLAVALSARHNPAAAPLLQPHSALLRELDEEALNWERLATRGA